MDALKGLTWLLLAQCAGEGLARLTQAPLPGPVIGLLILLVALRFEAVRRSTAVAAETLLAHLSLLFVPVGVGVMTHLALISQYGLQMLLVIAVSTLAGLAVTAFVLDTMLSRGADSGSDTGADVR